LGGKRVVKVRAVWSENCQVSQGEEVVSGERQMGLYLYTFSLHLLAMPREAR